MHSIVAMNPVMRAAVSFINAARIGQVQNRVASAAERNSAVHCGQKSAAVIAGTATCSLGTREYNKSGQIFRDAAQTIHRPNRNSDDRTAANRCSS